MPSLATSQPETGAGRSQSAEVENAPVNAPDSGERESKPGFWQRRLIQPIRSQLTQGVSPASLSVGIAAGSLCGIFPILGTTTVLTTFVAFVFRLNQPVMQAINWLAYPVQLALIPIFIRAGEFLFGADPITFSIPEMLEMFADSPGGFLSQFRMTFVHCTVAWLVAVPLLGALISFACFPALRAASRRISPNRNATTSTTSSSDS